MGFGAVFLGEKVSVFDGDEVGEKEMFANQIPKYFSTLPSTIAVD